MSLAWYLILVGVLFAIGVTTALMRRSAIIALMGVEIMLNAVNLVLVTFVCINSNVDGGIVAFLVMVVAAAEVVVGLLIIVPIYRSRPTTSMDDLSLLKN